MKSRDNHYVPQWHLRGFLEDGSSKLSHLKEKVIDTPSGPKTILPTRQYSPAQCFYQTDLYTTFFGPILNDEIEQKLFGHIDDQGAEAIRAFLSDDPSFWHNNFSELFLYLDAQKLRTPKGLDWIKSKYPGLNQNQLMLEMQSLRAIHCTIWAEGVRELVSAEDSDIKFIVSDHPVTIYNYGCPPNSEQTAYPNDPDIALKGTQTIFPLDKNRCLILTNLEYAKDPEDVDPLEHRTHAVRVRQSMVNTIEFINSRKLTAEEVAKINFVIKSRAKQSLAGGRKEWLFPENFTECSWESVRETLLPREGLWRFGGEIFAGHDDGQVHYQDAFGRTTPPNERLLKDTDERKIGRNDSCGCGSGKKYKHCCRDVPTELRTTWSELSVRERNLAFCRAIADILGLDNGRTWTDVRRDLSDEQISRIYGFYGSLWPRETNIYSMLPKSDGKFRGLYTGVLDIRRIGDCALRVAPYFAEFLVQNPIQNPNGMKPDYSPTESPNKYKYQALKDFSFMLALEPYIDVGFINLIPDPTHFDYDLFKGVMDLAEDRRPNTHNPQEFRDFQQLGIEDLLNSTNPMPHEVKVRMVVKEFRVPEKDAEAVISNFESSAQDDQLVLLDAFESGQLMQFRMAPNYEMALFIAQCTGSVILTDSESIWQQLLSAQHCTGGTVDCPWQDIYQQLKVLPVDVESFESIEKSQQTDIIRYRQLLTTVDEMVRNEDDDENRIASMASQACECNAQLTTQTPYDLPFEVSSPKHGFHDNTVNRLLIRSGCPRYDRAVRSVYYFPKDKPSTH